MIGFSTFPTLLPKSEAFCFVVFVFSATILAWLLGRSVGNVENPIILKACANQVTRQDHVNKEYELYLMNLMTNSLISSYFNTFAVIMLQVAPLSS
jgi:hypothetical protein